MNRLDMPGSVQAGPIPTREGGVFATVIQDAFVQGEEEEVARALATLCSDDAYGWASSGIYCFWDYATRRILYIGLADDLRRRFRQHTGLIVCKPNSCKKEKIDTYFASSPPDTRLGYSVFVRSTLEQAMEGNEVPVTEGIMIEAHRNSHGAWPEWNGVGGATAGQALANATHRDFLNAFVQPDSKFCVVARRSLRQLQDEDLHVSWEVWLHAARMLTVYPPVIGSLVLESRLDESTYLNALKRMAQFDDHEYLRRMSEAGYLDRKLDY